MTKFVKGVISSDILLDLIKSINGYENFKDLVLTDIEITNDSGIRFRAIISEECIEKEDPVMYCLGM